MQRIGLCFTGQPYSVTEVIEAAQLAESLGYDSVWVAEDSWTGRDAVTVLTAIALNTRRVRLGTCLIGAGTRHPVLTAMTFNTLRELAPGRLVLGVGLAAGWEPYFSGGAGWGGSSSLQTMRETVTGLRSLLSGGSVPWDEGARGVMAPRPWFEGAILPRAEPIPVYMGAVGPRMTGLAGEVADGLLLEMEALRELIPGRLNLFYGSAKKARIDPEKLEVVKLILSSVTGKDSLNQNAIGWAAKSVSLLSEDSVSLLGWDAERVARVRSAWARGDWETGRSAMTPQMARAFVAAGPKDVTIEVIAETLGTGVTLPVLIPYGGDIRPVIEAGAEHARSG